MSEQNKAIVRRYFEDILGGKIALADTLVAEEIDFYGPDYWGEAIHGRDAFKSFVGYLRAAFPDLRFALHEEITEDSWVATRFTLFGTQRGEWQGIAPTGRQVTLPGADFHRIANGQITEVRVFYDTQGLMQQLGVATAPWAT
jgi:steroid delta-isomerase-like uncharacterized protein